ncbi:MAG: DUF5615 family PIN-like protein [Cyanobacteriota bacterium]
MSLRLLLDENLSERLLLSLEDCYPGSNHVRQLGLGGATDRTIWAFAGHGWSVLISAMRAMAEQPSSSSAASH